MRARQIVRGIDDGPIQRAADDGDEDACRRDIAETAHRARRSSGRVSYRSSATGAHRDARPRGACRRRSLGAQRTGGAYCRPPLVHNALRPRAILSGEPWPTLRSNTFAVIADELDDAIGPILGQPELLAVTALDAEQAPECPDWSISTSRRRSSG